jgi:hypothetical protein
VLAPVALKVVTLLRPNQVKRRGGDDHPVKSNNEVTFGLPPIGSIRRASDGHDHSDLVAGVELNDLDDG